MIDPTKCRHAISPQLEARKATTERENSGASRPRVKFDSEKVEPLYATGDDDRPIASMTWLPTGKGMLIISIARIDLNGYLPNQGFLCVRDSIITGYKIDDNGLSPQSGCKHSLDGVVLYDIAAILYMESKNPKSAKSQRPTNAKLHTDSGALPGVERVVCIGTVRPPPRAPTPSSKRREEHRIIGTYYDAFC